MLVWLYKRLLVEVRLDLLPQFVCLETLSDLLDQSRLGHGHQGDPVRHDLLQLHQLGSVLLFLNEGAHQVGLFQTVVDLEPLERRLVMRLEQGVDRLRHLYVVVDVPLVRRAIEQVLVTIAKL